MSLQRIRDDISNNVFLQVSSFEETHVSAS